LGPADAYLFSMSKPAKFLAFSLPTFFACLLLLDSILGG
jgi:hypothetical protein